MKKKELLKILCDVVEGKDNIEKGAVGFNGYSFIFRDPPNSNESYIKTIGSSKFSSAGVWRGFLLKAMEDIKSVKLGDPSLNDVRYDLLFAGALKTIIPTLKFGGEILFHVWMLVKTPENKIFPATFYYGQSGTSLGGWKLSEAKKVFPLDFFSLINFSPFDFTNDELDVFIEAFELSLRKIPVSDFHGVFQSDMGYSLMGVKNGIPFIEDLGYSYDDDKIQNYLRSFEIFRDI